MASTLEHKNPNIIFDAVAFYRTAEAAELMGGLSNSTLARWRVTGEGPRYAKIGKTVLYKGQDLLAFIERRTFSSTSEASSGGTCSKRPITKAVRRS